MRPAVTVITPRQIYTSSLLVYSRGRLMYLVYFESGLSVECGDRSPHSTERHVFENEPDDLVEALPDLLSAEGADAVEPEAEHQAVFLSDADIEGVDK